MKRLYRVTWVDGLYGGGVRHYQSRCAAEHRAAAVREGWPEEPPATHFDDGRPAVPPARSVRIDVSDPIVFPDD